MAESDNKQENKDALRDSMRKKIAANEGSASPSLASSAGTSGRVLNANIAFSGPGLAQITVFCRQLATLIDVGIPLVQCLNTLAQRTEQVTMKTVVGDVARRVEAGESFSDALGQHPKVFSALVINVVRIGETGGILEDSLNYLADLMEKRYELRRKVTSAMAYPVFVLFICGLVILAILGFALPKFEAVYEGMELPALTRGVLALSAFVQSFWWLILGVVVGGFLFLRQLISSNEGVRRSWHGIILKLPIIGKVAVKINVTRTAKTIANLLNAGIPLLEALSISAQTSENLVVADMMQSAHDHLEKGGRLEEPLRQAGIFPPLVLDMIAIGDEAGRLNMMFDKIAESYESDVNHSIATMNAVIEPLLIVVMAAIVLTMSLAVLMPYWSLAKTMAE